MFSLLEECYVIVRNLGELIARKCKLTEEAICAAHGDTGGRSLPEMSFGTVNSLGSAKFAYAARRQHEIRRGRHGAVQIRE